MARRSQVVPLLLLAIAPATPGFAQYAAPGTPGNVGRPTAEGLVVSPKNGQSADQVWTDRYACSDWAKSQSGFDPIEPAPPGTDPTDLASRLARYRRAMAACLESRGYNVGYEAPPSKPPPQIPQPEHPIIVKQPPQAPPSGIQYHALRAQIEGGYSVATGPEDRALDNGWNGGLGLAWFPSSKLPVGLRADASYSRFGETAQSLKTASQSLGTSVSNGHEAVYGGDLDVEIDLPIGPNVREYVFGGVGTYREQTTFKANSNTAFCYFCFANSTTAEQTTTGWQESWNAGIGFEFAMADPSVFFIEARYLRIGSGASRMDFVPIRFGIRF